MFAATLFCSKLVAYVFLYWLPYYLNAIPIGGQRLTPQASASSTGCQPSFEPSEVKRPSRGCKMLLKLASQSNWRQHGMHDCDQALRC